MVSAAGFTVQTSCRDGAHLRLGCGKCGGVDCADVLP